MWKLSSNNLCLLLPFLPRMCAILPRRWSVGRPRLWSVATVGLATFCQCPGCFTRLHYFRPVGELLRAKKSTKTVCPQCKRVLVD